MKLALIAGETSGDQLGGWLISAIKSHHPDAQFIGLGGENMIAQGLHSLFAMEEISLIGFAEVVPHYFAIRARITRMVEFLEREKPDALVTIDSAGFNFRVVNALRKRGIIRPKFIHYVAPTVWAYKPQRARLIASLYDALFCLLPFEPPYFEAVGLPTHFIGHQIAWEWKTKGDGAAFRARHGIAATTPLLALFPGSRNGELTRMLAIYEATVAALKEKIPDLELLVQVPPRMVKRLTEATKNWPVKSHILASTAEKKDAFAAANVALAKSGTIALECALAGLPSVTTYKASAVTAAILRRVLKTKFVNLANILSAPPSIPPASGEDKVGIIPELLQNECNPQSLVAALLPLFTDTRARDAQLHGLQNVAAKLGVGDAQSPSEKAAKTILSMLDGA